MQKVIGVIFLVAAVAGCGGSDGGDRTSNSPEQDSSASLRGIWLGQCELSGQSDSQRVQVDVGDDGSYTHSSISYLNSTNCDGDLSFSSSAIGRYTVDGGQPASAGSVSPIDINFSRVQITPSTALTLQLQSANLSFEDALLTQGITDINNAPLSFAGLPEDLFTVYSLSGNTLSVGYRLTNGGTTPATRLTVADTAFTRLGPAPAPTPVGDGTNTGLSSLPIDPQTGIPTSGTAACGTTLTENITIPTTLVNTSAVCDYLIEGLIDIRSDLIIEPGVAIRASANTLIIVDGGRIVAEGTAQNPIVVDGNVHLAGYWVGIDFREGRESSFNHFHMADAGQVCSVIFCPDVAFELDDVRVSFTNSSVSNSFVAGMLISDDVELVEFSNNRFFNNQRAGLIVDPELIPDIDAASDYSGGQFPNGTPMLQVSIGGHTQGRFYDWKKLSAPYFISGFFNPEGGTWRVAPGVEIVMDEEAWIRVEGNAVVEMIGTANEPVIIRGLESTAGYWDGINFSDSDNDNIFEHVRISHFGTTGNLASALGAINMNDSQLTLNEVTIDNGRGDGIRCDEPFGLGDRVGSFLRIIANVQITNITGVMVDSECQFF